MGSNPTSNPRTPPSAFTSPHPIPWGPCHHSPQKKKKTQTKNSSIQDFFLFHSSLPASALGSCFLPPHFLFHNSCQSISSERDEWGWLGWGGVGWGDRRGGGGGGGQGGGEGIHLIPGSRCIYWRLITEQQSHHALDDFIIWFLGGGGERRGCVAGWGGRECGGGARSGTKARGRCWSTVEHGAQNKVQWKTSVLQPWAQILMWFMGFYL